jgi:hypothetical protein
VEEMYLGSAVGFVGRLGAVFSAVTSNEAEAFVWLAFDCTLDVAAT